MSQIETFRSGEFELRITPIGDSFTVEAPGLARALGFRDAYRLVETIPDTEKGYTTACTPGGDQRIWHLTEPGFYRALGQRQAARVKDDAIRQQVERFQGWVYREVLPQIRRTGTYGQVRELTRLELINLARDAEIGRLTAEQKVAELEPAAHSWETLAEASGDYSLREAAQVLNRDPAISTGQNRLARYLREIGWTDAGGTPYQQHVDSGRLVLRSRTYDHPRTGEAQLATQIRVTAKGLHELHRLLGGQRPLLLTAAAS